MSQHFPALLVVAPLIMACVISGVGFVARRWCFPLALAAMAISLISALGMLLRVMASGPFLYKLGGWDPPWGISYNLDYLNSLVLVAVAGVALLNLLTTWDLSQREQPQRVGPLYTLYVLSVTGLLGMVVTGDAFNLYVLLEISSLTGYALIAMGSRSRAPLAALNYVFLGTLGACFYLLGVGFIYMVTGTLNMADMAERLPALYQSKAVLAAFVTIMLGLLLKAAFFPLHGWLPAAYSYAPSAVSSLLAPLATKVMLYVMMRVILTVFTPAYVFKVLSLGPALIWLSALAIVAGGVMALAERDFKRMLCFIVVAEVGYMVGGAWLGNRSGFTGAILHLLNDAAMTLCVFIAVAAIVRKHQYTGLVRLRGLFGKMPWTLAALVLGGMSIIGVPPTCGFFSKWYLIKGAIEAGAWHFVVALLASSLINTILFFRLFEIAFFEPLAEHGENGHGHAPVRLLRDEAPAFLVLPLWISAAGLLALGLASGWLVSQVIVKALPAGLS